MSKTEPLDDTVSRLAERVGALRDDALSDLISDEPNTASARELLGLSDAIRHQVRALVALQAAIDLANSEGNESDAARLERHLEAAHAALSSLTQSLTTDEAS